MNRKLENLAAGVVTFGVIGALVTAGIAVSVYLRVIALMWLWYWFVVPFGIMSLGFWHALGLSGLIAFLTYEFNGAKADTDYKQSYVENLVKSTMVSVIMLFFGFIYQLFM